MLDRRAHQPDNAVRRGDDEADEQKTDDQQIDRRRDRHRRDLLQRAEEEGADQRADPARGAADERHGNRVDGVFEPEGRGGLQKADVVGERRAGHAHERAGDRGRDQLEPQRRHAGGFRRQFIVADGGEAIAEPRAFDQPRDRDSDDCQQQHHQEQIADIVAERPEGFRPHDVGAARTADIVPVDDQRLEHDRERERGDGEECAAQPQRQVAHAEADHARHHAAKADQDRDRQRQQPVTRDGRIGAEREEGGRAEIHIAAIAAEDVPRGREHDVLGNDIAGEEQVVISERQRAGERRAADDETDEEKQIGAHC